MPTLNDITNAASYRGDANLGGGGGLVIDIDTKPIQQLAQYTFLYHKSQYDQRQKDADEKIKQLGTLAPYDLVNGIDKDKGELINAQAKLTEYMAAEAASGTPKNPKEKMQKEIAFQSKISDQIKLINAANARKIKLDAYKNTVQADSKLTAQQKELKIKQAEQIFNSTDIYTLPNIPETDITMPENGKAAVDQISVLKKDKDGNAVIDETISQFSIGNTWKQAYLHANDLNLPILPDNATQQQKDEYEQKKLAFSQNGLGAWQSAAEVYNSALNNPNYKITETTNGINVLGEPPLTKLTETVDINKVRQDNPIMGGVISLAERYNAYAEKRIEDIKKGYFIDNVTGEEVLFTGGDKAEDVKLIDVTKPLKPEDLSFLDMFAKASPDKVDKKFIQTDNAIQQGTLQETIRNNKADQYLKGKQLDNEEEKWKAAQTGGTTQINGAMERAKKIYSDLLKLADKNGVISPDKLRGLNVEQRKYLGIEKVETSDQGVSRSIFQPLDISQGKDKVDYVIQLDNGNINVLKDAKLLDNKIQYKGLLDNTKSTNLRNVATNILNEELRTAGSKELNSYMGVDVTGAITQNTSGSSSSSSGGSSTKTVTTRTGKDGKEYTNPSGDGITWVAADGTTVKLNK